MPEKTCSVCKGVFHLHKHENGLVFDDRFFICQDCAKGSSEEELTEWCGTIMQSPTNGMPIALWLIHEQNKEKQPFSQKK